MYVCWLDGWLAGSPTELSWCEIDLRGADPSHFTPQHNYGEGSAREHASLQPRFLNCKVILA